MLKKGAPLLNPYLDLYEDLADGCPTEALERARKKLIWAYSWAIPTPEAIQAIAALSPIVELGAGTGYWAWLLRQAGAQVRALDIEPAQPPCWSNIERGDTHTLDNMGARTLLLCFPPSDSPMAREALAGFRGEYLVYVGEWRGRTANEEFHALVDSCGHLEREIELPNWPGWKTTARIYRVWPIRPLSS